MRYVGTGTEANHFDLGSMAVITILLTTINITVHARSECSCTSASAVSYSLRSIDYYRPLQQRQIIRILLMPPVFATISFFSYRYFRDYTYYSLVETVYGALGVSAFFMLLIQYVSSSPAEGKMIFARKSKKNMLFPFCCWRYRPGKPHFMHTLKVSWHLTVDAWGWLFRSGPFCNIVYLAHLSLSRVSLQRNIMCSVSIPHLWHVEGGGEIFWQVHTGPDQYSVHFAAIYLDSAKYVLAQSLFSTQHWRVSSFVSSSVALYALLVFYTLTKENLEGRQPLAKFLSIKLIIFFTFGKRRQFNTAFLKAYHMERSRIFVQYLAKSQCHQGYDLLDCDKCRRWSASTVHLYWGIQLL